MCWLAWRSLRSRYQNRFISLMSWICMIGLGLGVAALITVLSVMNGFERELKTRILGMTPHVLAYTIRSDWSRAQQQIAQLPGVVGAEPFVFSQGLLMHGGQSQFVEFEGIGPHWADVSIMPQHSQKNAMERLTATPFSMIIGQTLADQLGLAIGDDVTLLVASSHISLAGWLPRAKRFHIVGTFQVGYDFDSKLAFIRLPDAQALLQMPNRIHAFNIHLSKPWLAPSWVDTWQNKAADDQLSLEDWTKHNAPIFDAVQMEKTLMFFILMLIIVIAAFNILSAMMMMVQDKTVHLAILQALGASPRQVFAFMMWQGVLLSGVGLLLGTGIGVLISQHITAWFAWLKTTFHLNWFSEDVYYINFLPSYLMGQDVLRILGWSCLFQWLACAYPAWRASQLIPAEVLRHG